MIYPLSIKFFWNASMLPMPNFSDPMMYEQAWYDDEICVSAIKMVFFDFGPVAVSVLCIVETVFELSEVVAKDFRENISGLVPINKASII